MKADRQEGGEADGQIDKEADKHTLAREKQREAVARPKICIRGEKASGSNVHV